METVAEVARLPWLQTFRLGHFEHSDCDCYSVAPHETAGSNESELADQVCGLFTSEGSFSKLQTLYLEQNCEFTPLLYSRLKKSRPALVYRFSVSLSAVDHQMALVN